MSFLNIEYLWLFLFLVVAFMKKDFTNLRLSAYGYIVTFTFIVLALTRPVIVQEPITTQELLNDVVVAVDLSYSMQATDILPSRLEFAKEALRVFVKSEQDYENWLQEQETFSDLVAKQEKKEFSKTKLAKK